VVGVRLESFLVEGRQTLVPGGAAGLVFGQSITDACLGWEATVRTLEDLADAVVRRRARPDGHRLLCASQAVTAV
jgi:3-deoxy-7-phosphoheptulonate synthase